MGLVWVVLGSPGGHTHGDEGERKRKGGKRKGANQIHVGLLIRKKGLEGHVFDENHRNTQASLALQKGKDGKDDKESKDSGAPGPASRTSRGL